MWLLYLLIATVTKLKEEMEARLNSEKRVKLLEPKAQFYDDVAGSKDNIEMGHVAKVLDIRRLASNKFKHFININMKTEAYKISEEKLLFLYIFYTIVFSKIIILSFCICSIVEDGKLK